MTMREHLEIMQIELQEIVAKGVNSRTVAQRALYDITAQLLVPVKKIKKSI